MSKINPGIHVPLSKGELQLLHHFKTYFEHSGLQIVINQNEVTVTSVPTCLYSRSMKEVSKTLYIYIYIRLFLWTHF